MDSEGWTLWLAIVSGSTFLIIGFLSGLTAIQEYRSLASAGFPRPSFLIWRRASGILHRQSSKPSQLEGHRAWLSWDIRWLTGGQTMATVVAMSEGSALELELDKSLSLAAFREWPAIELHRVRFVPRSSVNCPYELAAVRGVLEATLPAGMIATAEVVVYPMTDSEVLGAK